MAKTYNMKWRDEDVDQLRREIRNFNRKVDRLMKKGSPEVKAALPPKLSMKTAKAGIQSRADYNRQLKQIQRFTEKGSEQLMKTKGGVTAPKFEIKEMQARVQIINAARKKRLQKLPEPEMGNLPLMGRISRENLKPKTAPGKIKPEGWEKYKRSVYKQSDPAYYKEGDKRYKENFLKGYKETLGEKDADIVRKMIENNLTDEQFFLASIENEQMAIGFVYDPIDKEERRKKIYRELYSNISKKKSFTEEEFEKFLVKYGAD